MAVRSNYKQVFATKKRGLNRALHTALQQTSLDAISRMIDRTPVDTGAAKAHWFARGTPTESFDKDKTDKSGNSTKARAKRDLKQVRIGDRVYLVNSAPYFIFLERGTSDQAPSGVVAITLAELQLTYRRNLKVALSQEGIK
jgi:hypothetical protein